MTSGLPWSAEPAPLPSGMRHMAWQPLERLARPRTTRGRVACVPLLKSQHRHPAMRFDRLGKERLRRVKSAYISPGPKVTDVVAFMRGIDNRLVASLIANDVANVGAVVHKDQCPGSIWKRLAPHVDAAASALHRVPMQVATGESHALVRSTGTQLLIHCDDLLVAPEAELGPCLPLGEVPVPRLWDLPAVEAAVRIGRLVVGADARALEQVGVVPGAGLRESCQARVAVDTAAERVPIGTVERDAPAVT
eukprot:scaffold125963_cov69-Phaeocystis_antarctica.AAC.3